jgi:hypothetical protein
MQPSRPIRRGDNYEALVDTLLTALLTICRILGAVIHIVWLLVFAVYRAVDSGNQNEFRDRKSIPLCDLAPLYLHLPNRPGSSSTL